MNIIKKTGLTKDLSVNELLIESSKVYFVENTDRKAAYSEIPKR
ncbi:MAG: hypothetical protein QXZ12_08190 [Thermoplasmata archaeon]